MAKLLYRIWSFFVSSARLWQLLDRTGIAVFVGPNGSGKSLAMIHGQLGTLGGVPWQCFNPAHKHQSAFRDHCELCSTCALRVVVALSLSSPVDLADAVRRGVLCADGGELLASGSTGTRRVFSTVPLLEGRGVEHPNYEPLNDYRQLLTIEHADVLFDEVAGIADASSSASMPVQVINWMHQLRKRDVRLRVTTPAYARCALPIRQVAQVVVETRAFFPARSEGRLWRPRRLVLATAYDAFAFDEFMAADGQRSRLKAAARALIWVPGSAATAAYDTHGAVLQLGHVNEAGMCVACGGTRSRPRCGCTDEHEGDLRVETVVSANGTRTKRAVPL